MGISVLRNSACRCAGTVALPQINILLVGDRLTQFLCWNNIPLDSHPRLQLIHASQSVSMAERPVIALRNKTGLIYARMLELVRFGSSSGLCQWWQYRCINGDGDAEITMLPHLKRPALCSSLPNLRGNIPSCLIWGAMLIVRLRCYGNLPVWVIWSQNMYMLFQLLKLPY